MRYATMITTLATLCAISPVLAADPGANPSGSWSCLGTGEVASAVELVMTETGYTFAPGSGPETGAGSYTIDRNIILVLSGPLRDRYNIRRGYFDVASAPLSLAFSAGSNKFLSCQPKSEL